MQQVQKGITKLMSEDAAIEAEVTILTTDVATLTTTSTNLQTAFDKLAAEVTAGTPLNPQTLTDLSNAVSAVTAGIGALPTGPTPPAPAP
jgi:prefoldin subunit 5